MKLFVPAGLVAFAATSSLAQFQNTCSQQLMDAVAECQKSAGIDDMKAFIPTIKDGAGRDKYCGNAWAGCAKLKSLAPASDCIFWVWKGWSVNPSKELACPTDQTTTLCTPNRLAVSEGYGLLYANTVQSNANEQFAYNNETKAIIAKSNGQCLDVYKDNNQFKLHTYACDSKNANQKWTIANHKVQHAVHGVCLEADLGHPGAAVGVAPCSGASETNQWFDACERVPKSYVQLRAATGKHLLEYNGDLYLNPGGHDFNDLFEWGNGLLKSASNGQCLDVYKDGNGQFKLHTYACDSNNGNQKWTIANNVVKHATHNNICLDADPTYADAHAQVWECTPNNPNQQWTLLQYSK